MAVGADHREVGSWIEYHGAGACRQLGQWDQMMRLYVAGAMLTVGSLKIEPAYATRLAVELLGLSSKSWIALSTAMPTKFPGFFAGSYPVW